MKSCLMKMMTLNFSIIAVGYGEATLPLPNQSISHLFHISSERSSFQHSGIPADLPRFSQKRFEDVFETFPGNLTARILVPRTRDIPNNRC